ncbi:hypothetical protein I7I53_11493 [Histoplasma capsulatum var. duboisii H88]|uniref:Uncharacterized protein n=1 Tax=Ajellomyces capsulatus (strain H88) TaxID=544711 RepID=A0A8A1LDI3_AJEC8|nr:hypothetical protein I7I53_11493 [Histoplasma capsulatum var. duboisii H88]
MTRPSGVSFAFNCQAIMLFIRAETDNRFHFILISIFRSVGLRICSFILTSTTPYHCTEFSVFLEPTMLAYRTSTVHRTLQTSAQTEASRLKVDILINNSLTRLRTLNFR